MQVAIVKRPLDEPHCGDDAGYWRSGSKIVFGVVDGLGHGRGAERVARTTMECVGRHYYEPLSEIFACCDQVLQTTRGVALGLAVVDTNVATLTYAGIGNTRAVIIDGRTVRFVSNYGIVGGGYRTLTPETVPFITGDVLILATDGIMELIDVSGYSRSVKMDVRCLAEKIVQDWANGKDDIAVLTFRNEG